MNLSWREPDRQIKIKKGRKKERKKEREMDREEKIQFLLGERE